MPPALPTWIKSITLCFLYPLQSDNLLNGTMMPCLCSDKVAFRMLARLVVVLGATKGSAVKLMGAIETAAVTFAPGSQSCFRFKVVLLVAASSTALSTSALFICRMLVPPKFTTGTWAPLFDDDAMEYGSSRSPLYKNGANFPPLCKLKKTRLNTQQSFQVRSHAVLQKEPLAPVGIGSLPSLGPTSTCLILAAFGVSLSGFWSVTPIMAIYFPSSNESGRRNNHGAAVDMVVMVVGFTVDATGVDFFQLEMRAPSAFWE